MNSSTSQWYNKIQYKLVMSVLMNSTSLCSSKLTFYPVFKVYIVLALTTLILSLVAVCGNLTLIIHYLKQVLV